MYSKKQYTNPRKQQQSKRPSQKSIANNLNVPLQQGATAGALHLLSPEDVMQLQRMVGNQAVEQILTHAGNQQLGSGQVVQTHPDRVIQRLKQTPQQVKDAITDGTISSYLIKLYSLEYRHHNDALIYLRAPAQQHSYWLAKDAQYWYRAMTSDEFDKLNRNNRFYGSSYGGIAPNREYVVQDKYFGNLKPATHVVEFKTPSAGFLYEQFSPHKLDWGDIKAEGGGTYGLGPDGNGGGAAGAAFNKLLATRQITWELVDLKLKNPLD